MIISVFDRVENTVGKGENAGYQHFLLFPQCFEKASFPETSKGVIVREWVNEMIRSTLLMSILKTRTISVASVEAEHSVTM